MDKVHPLCNFGTLRARKGRRVPSRKANSGEKTPEVHPPTLRMAALLLATSWGHRYEAVWSSSAFQHRLLQLMGEESPHAADPSAGLEFDF